MSIKKSGIRRRVATGIAVGAVGVALAGCAPSSSDDNGAQSRELTTIATPAGTASVADLTWNLPQGEPTSIDPPNSPTISGASVVSNMCEPLLSVDEEYNLGPNLVSFEQVTPTQIVYTLEAEATFWDGQPVTVDDIVFSLQRAAAPESVVSFAFANVASISATSDTQVTVELAQPDVLFNPTMATFAGMVVQKAFTEAAGPDFGTAAGGVMCSGPYEFVSWTPGESIEVTRNDDYWNDDLPLLAENVTFRFITDSSAATQALEAGEIDGSYQIDPSAIPALENSDAGRLFFGPSMESVGINVVRADGPLADVALREALQKMIDREALADVVFNGAAEPMYMYMSPATWPNDQTEKYQAAADEWADTRSFDIEAATALVDESDYDGTPLVLALTAGDETMSRIAQLVQQQASDAGITIELNELQPLDFQTASYDAETRERFGIDLILGGSFNAAHEPLEPIGFTYAPDAAYNYTGFDDPEASELLTEALQTYDNDARADLTLSLLDITEAQSAVIPLVSTDTVTFLSNALGGAITSFAYLSMPSMAYIGGTGD